MTLQLQTSTVHHTQTYNNITHTQTHTHSCKARTNDQKLSLETDQSPQKLACFFSLSFPCLLALFLSCDHDFVMKCASYGTFATFLYPLFSLPQTLHCSFLSLALKLNFKPVSLACRAVSFLDTRRRRRRESMLTKKMH